MQIPLFLTCTFYLSLLLLLRLPVTTRSLSDSDLIRGVLGHLSLTGVRSTADFASILSLAPGTLLPLPLSRLCPNRSMQVPIYDGPNANRTNESHQENDYIQTVKGNGPWSSYYCRWWLEGKGDKGDYCLRKIIGERDTVSLLSSGKGLLPNSMTSLFAWTEHQEAHQGSPLQRLYIPQVMQLL